MGILKLADEMGLSCIRAYKLDALKSVRKAYEERNLGVADNCSEAIVTLAENSGPIRSLIGDKVMNAAEDSSTAIVVQTGKQHANYTHVFLHFSSPHQLYLCASCFLASFLFA